MDSQNFQRQIDPHRWMVFGILSTVYFFVYFHRVSPSVIAPDLLTAFETDATALGFMSSMYFYVYSLEQPLVGYFSDRLGPRRVVGYWTLTAFFGCLLFALAPTIGWASAGRALIGFGVGGVYVPALKAFSQWFRARDFATMNGLLLAVGNFGALVATTPLAWMAKSWGWRPTFLVIGGITLGLAFMTFLLLREYREPEASDRPSATDQAQAGPSVSVWQVLLSLRFLVLLLIFAGFFATFLTFQGLWATPYLMSVFGLERLPASELNMLVPLGFIIGAPLFGRLTDRFFHNRIHLLIWMLIFESAIWTGLTYGWAFLGIRGMIPALFLMGASSAAFATAFWALVRETTPKPIMGSISGLLNPAPFMGVAILQVVTGAILDRVGRVGEAYPPEAYQDAFLLCLLINLAGLLLCVAFREHLAGKAH
jgi:predicted MFS family arabinose efflux permease